jgi:hypothetical protein
MASYERPLIYGGLAVVAIVLLCIYGSPTPKPKPKAAKPASALAARHSDYTDADYAAHFDPPKAKLRDIFLPVVRGDMAADMEDSSASDADKIPATVAGGDPNWVYTGMAIVDGARLALLENASTHQSGFVQEGDRWKNSKISKITSQSVTFVDADGDSEAVLRFDPDAAPASKPLPDAGFQPLSVGPNLNGPIGRINVQPLPLPNTQSGFTRNPSFAGGQGK